ncbi:MAG: DNA repair protein RecN [Eubacterium sp.]|nr:DNA repair protein RecN [Eubacterium sp.]
MIDHLSIKDFATISDLEISFGDGLNVITGETGAGKSIVIEAAYLALGGRADSSFVRHGKDKAVVQLLTSDADTETAIIREISQAGRNVCKINGELTTRAAVETAARAIADIHGQYDNQVLLDPERHMEIVERFLWAETEPVKSEFAEAYSNYKETRLKLEELLAKEREGRKSRDYYEHVIKEIDTAKLTPGEDSELTDRIAVLKNSEKIFEAAGTADELLTGGEANILSMLGEAVRSISSIRAYSSDIDRTASGLENIYYDLKELASDTHSILESAGMDPGDVDRAIGRLDRIDNLKKKYGSSIEEILAFRDETADKIRLLENFDSDRVVLENELHEKRIVLTDRVTKLTAVRTKSAGLLAAAIKKELLDLNFKQAELEININKAPAITSNGGDVCEILISVNPGEPLRLLEKTASGGEISRIMLAIKNVTASYDNIPTMIFDEIDSGISGITASVVARKLKEISKEHQIICITHLPQIAAAADHNYRIYKDTDDQATYTHIEALSEKEKTAEIARLIGGDNITDITLASASELIDSMTG